MQVQRVVVLPDDVGSISSELRAMSKVRHFLDMAGEPPRGHVRVHMRGHLRVQMRSYARGGMRGHLGNQTRGHLRGHATGCVAPQVTSFVASSDPLHDISHQMAYQVTSHEELKS